jgi:uncharacterized protein YuzE
MRLEYDADVDAAYLYLVDGTPDVEVTVSVDPVDIGGEVNLDLDLEGRIVGIEIFRASRLLPRGVVSP